MDEIYIIDDVECIKIIDRVNFKKTKHYYVTVEKSAVIRVDWYSYKKHKSTFYYNKKYGYSIKEINNIGPYEFHRDTKYGPACIYYDEHNDKQISQMIYMYNSVKHRDNGPAEILYFSNGDISEEYYYKHGIRHNEQGPANIHYNRDGVITNETYYIDGDLHNENGPAALRYNNDGILIAADYCINDILHNTHGPASIYYNNNGSIIKKEYFVDGDYIPNEVAEWLLDNNLTLCSPNILFSEDFIHHIPDEYQMEFKLKFH